VPEQLQQVVQRVGQAGLAEPLDGVQPGGQVAMPRPPQEPAVDAVAGEDLLEPIALLALDRLEQAEHRVPGGAGQPPRGAVAGGGRGRIVQRQGDPAFCPLVELAAVPPVPHGADEVVAEQVQAEQGQRRRGRGHHGEQDVLDRGGRDPGGRPEQERHAQAGEHDRLEAEDPQGQQGVDRVAVAPPHLRLHVRSPAPP
jgi:hypothetical protein